MMQAATGAAQEPFPWAETLQVVAGEYRTFLAVLGMGDPEDRQGVKNVGQLTAAVSQRLAAAAAAAGAPTDFPAAATVDKYLHALHALKVFEDNPATYPFGERPQTLGQAYEHGRRLLPKGAKKQQQMVQETHETAAGNGYNPRGRGKLPAPVARSEQGASGASQSAARSLTASKPHRLQELQEALKKASESFQHLQEKMDKFLEDSNAGEQVNRENV